MLIFSFTENTIFASLLNEFEIMLVRNTLGVIAGLLVATTVITIAINLDTRWMEYDGDFPYKHRKTVLKTAKDEISIALFVSAGFASILGGITTALIVKEAKQAYAMLIGFILFGIAILDIMFTPHPLYYKIAIFFIFFPFSWLGGKIVDVMYKKWFVKKG